VDQRSVGRNISTKGVDGDVREDVTLLYKHPEGQLEGRTRGVDGLGSMTITFFSSVAHLLMLRSLQLLLSRRS